MTERKKPTSPHLQIYKWNINSFTSILHRFTGILLYASIVLVSWYIVYYTYQINLAAEGAEKCDCTLMNNIFIIASIAIIFSLYYHFCNGIRHLFWDIGKGFEIKTAKTNGFLVLILALILTTITIGTILYLKLL